jgi:hypothetical protein
MPRHMSPQVGTLVWYFADPTRNPSAAIVVKRISDNSFNLIRFNGETGVAAPALAVPFLENSGLRSVAGAYCTPTGIQDVNDGVTDMQSASQRATAAAVTAGGANYAVGNTVTIANGVVLRVTTVSAGAITAVTIVNPGSAVKPGPGTAQAQVSTSGTGTGATFTITWTDN